MGPLSKPSPLKSGSPVTMFLRPESRRLSLYHHNWARRCQECPSTSPGSPPGEERPDLLPTTRASQSAGMLAALLRSFGTGAARAVVGLSLCLWVEASPLWEPGSLMPQSLEAHGLGSTGSPVGHGEDVRSDRSFCTSWVSGPLCLSCWVHSFVYTSWI